MIFYKTETQVQLIRQSCLIVSQTLALVGELLKPGITGMELDRKAEEFIQDHKAKPGFKGLNGFPASLCISINEAVVHGIPSKRVIKEGDIVSIDCGVLYNEYFGDSAYTFAVGDVDEGIMTLLRVTNESLYKGIEMAVAGRRIGDIGFAVQEHAEKKYGYGIVRELVGHGIGRNLHEAPEVPNYGKKGRGLKLKEGLVIAIEPMVNLGTKEVVQAEDGWTIFTKDRKPSAHFEHTVLVRSKEALILTDHTIVEDSVKKNPYIKEMSEKKAIFANRN